MKKQIALIALVLFSFATFSPVIASVDVDPQVKKTTVVEKEADGKTGCSGCAHKCGDKAKTPCADKHTKAEPCKSDKKAEATPCKTEKKSGSCCGSKTKKQ